MWTRFTLLPLLVLSTMAGAEPADDQEPILRCLIATGALAEAEDPATASAGLMAGLYWLGRLDPSLAEAEIERRMAGIFVRLSQADIQQDLKRCGAEMQERGAMMERIGEKLKQGGAKAETH